MKFGFFIRWTVLGRAAKTRVIEGFETREAAGAALKTAKLAGLFLIGDEVEGNVYGYGEFEGAA